jgi:oxygen-independent coproporphyrinogen-3 oxidase
MAAPTPLGIYMHVPFCRHACPYCDFYKIELRERPARERLEFPALLRAEHQLLLEAHADLAARPLDTLYFGGGTPSTLSPPTVADLLSRLIESHGATPTLEITLEANPENLTPPRCKAWREAGITRLSIGAQAFQPRHLDRLERLHGPETITLAVTNARAAGIGNLSLDLMFALPGQTHDEWIESLAKVIDLAPDHISFYGLTLHEHTPFHAEAEAGTLVPLEDDVQAVMYLEGGRLLEEAGFEHYEISNFARPGFRSRHNQRYWTQQDVLGLGPGAHSNIGALRWRNPDDLDAWKGSLLAHQLPRMAPEVLDAQSTTDEALFRLLRRREGFSLNSNEASSRVFAAWLASPVGEHACAQGWIETDGTTARLTREGWLRSDALLLDMVNRK